MPYSVPQYIDVEDKVAGPLTVKQLLWFFGGGGILILLWNVLDKPAFFVAAVPISLLTAAFAFWKPNGRTLILFVGDGLLFLFKPKLYTWRRVPVIKKHSKMKKPHKKSAQEPEHKKLTADDIAALTRTLDSRGTNRNQDEPH